MGIAERIKNLRLASGRSEDELAAMLGISIHSYWDLEAYDNELFTCVSLEQAQRLMRALGTDLTSFISPAGELSSRVSLDQAVTALRELAEQRGWSVAELSDEVGWELDEFLRTPRQTAAAQNLDFFKDIAAPLGLDWHCLLPSDGDA
jgi:transcriptional regulator with XRE-family HTH domain